MGHAGISDLSFARHMYIHGQVENKMITSLVDTGASGFAFASQSLCDLLHLTPIALSSPISLVGFEGGQGSHITHKVLFNFVLKNHAEKITAFVIQKCKYELILGLPWLE